MCREGEEHPQRRHLWRGGKRQVIGVTLYLLRASGTQSCFVPNHGAIGATFSLEHPDRANKCCPVGGLRHLEGLLGLVIGQFLVDSCKPRLRLMSVHRLSVRG